VAETQSYAEGLKRIYALESERDVRALGRMLDNPVELSPDRTVRAAAAAALGRIGDPIAGERLLAAADDPSREVRYAVVRSLGFVKYSAAGPKLVDALDDESLNVRRAAVVSLGLVRFEEAIPELRRAMEAQDPWTRLYAAESLAAIGDRSLAEKLPAAARREKRLAFSRRKRWQKLAESVGRLGNGK
jgi:HEAT repeat protein